MWFKQEKSAASGASEQHQSHLLACTLMALMLPLQSFYSIKVKAI